MKRLSGVLMGALLAFASAGIAGAGAGPGTKPVAANIFGTVADGSSNSDPSNGNACNVTSWVDECPSGSCECATLASPRISNSKLTVANVFFTIDRGVNPATQSAVNNGPSPSCNLVLGTASITAKDNSSSETLNFIGTTCKHVIRITATNPQGVHDKDILSGGWGISDAPASNPLESGWGTFTGVGNDKTAAATLHLQGWASK